MIALVCACGHGYDLHRHATRRTDTRCAGWHPGQPAAYECAAWRPRRVVWARRG